MFPQAIRFHFGTPITQVNLHRQTVHASTAGSIATQVRCEGNSLSCSMLISEACLPSCKKVRLHARKLDKHNQAVPFNQPAGSLVSVKQRV